MEDEPQREPSTERKPSKPRETSEPRESSEPRRKSSPARQPPGTRPTIYVGHLPYDVRPEELEEKFSKFGKIVNTSIKRRFAFIVRKRSGGEGEGG